MSALFQLAMPLPFVIYMWKEDLKQRSKSILTVFQIL